MHFHAPLDDVQSNTAVQQHAQMRINLQALREQYPPRSKGERQLFRLYRSAIQDFAREVVKPRDNIDPEFLNAQSYRVVAAFARYWDARRKR